MENFTSIQQTPHLSGCFIDQVASFDLNRVITVTTLKEIFKFYCGCGSKMTTVIESLQVSDNTGTWQNDQKHAVFVLL